MDEGMEGKDLAYEKKVEYFIAELKSLIRQCKELKHTPVESNGYRVSFEPETGKYKIVFSNTDIVLAQENKEGFKVDAKSIDKYNQLVAQAEEQERATLERPAGLVEPKELEKYLEKQKEMKGEGQIDGDEGNSGEENEEEKDDEKPDEEKKPEEKRSLELQKPVIYIDLRTEKLTENDYFANLVDWAKEYEEVAIEQGRDQYTYTIKGRRQGEKEYAEIANMQNEEHGKIPDITINLIKDGDIKEVQPLATLKVNNDQIIAIIRDETGIGIRAVYCTKHAGEQKFTGVEIPEKSGENVVQSDIEERAIMDSRNNSVYDFADLGKEYEVAKAFEEAGGPSEEPGVQLEEITGTSAQNRIMREEDIEKYLTEQYGEGYPEQRKVQAKQIKKLMDEGKDFPDAKKQVLGEREEGGLERGPQDRRGIY